MADVQRLIDQIMSTERIRRSSHFSDRVFTDEPILTTGRQMASYLPDRYREMRAISRWQADSGGGRGRWLSEAELFYRQGRFMEDFEDDCPYHGTFKAYFPTYNAMSDRQLRGYFTWRAAVRAGTVEETSLSFAYVYLYELLCGIGTDGPIDGFSKLRGFWEAYRGFAPEIDRFARVWLHDYTVYHGLDPALLDDHAAVAFDRALIALAAAQRESLGRLDAAGRPRRGQAALLPPDADFEQRVLDAVDGLSTYRPRASSYFREDPEGLRHVCCAVFARLCAHYAKRKSGGLVESLFGEVTALPYTMFSSAVFFTEERHPDTVYELNGVDRFTCENGLWTCERVHGRRTRSARLGEAMRAADRALRAAVGYAHPLKEEQLPKYLRQIVDREVGAWVSWKEAHAPRRIEIDLSKLTGIRDAAAQTREALLVDEEREEAPLPAAPAADRRDQPGARDDATGGAGGALQESGAAGCAPPHDGGAARESAPAVRAPTGGAPDDGARRSGGPSPAEGDGAPAPAAGAPAREDGPAAREQAGAGESVAGPLDARQRAFLSALLAGDAAGLAQAAGGASADLIADAVNEALFDLIGDTVVELGAAGPELVEDYREDVEELLAHE